MTFLFQREFFQGKLAHEHARTRTLRRLLSRSLKTREFLFFFFINFAVSRWRAAAKLQQHHKQLSLRREARQVNLFYEYRCVLMFRRPFPFLVLVRNKWIWCFNELGIRKDKRRKGKKRQKKRKLPTFNSIIRTFDQTNIPNRCSLHLPIRACIPMLEKNRGELSYHEIKNIWGQRV